MKIKPKPLCSSVLYCVHTPTACLLPAVMIITTSTVMIFLHRSEQFTTHDLLKVATFKLHVQATLKLVGHTTRCATSMTTVASHYPLLLHELRNILVCRHTISERCVLLDRAPEVRCVHMGRARSFSLPVDVHLPKRRSGCIPVHRRMPAMPRRHISPDIEYAAQSHACYAVQFRSRSAARHATYVGYLIVCRLCVLLLWPIIAAMPQRHISIEYACRHMLLPAW